MVIAERSGALTASGFAVLRDTFARHVDAARGGMAFCVYRDGLPLARFYGGRTAKDDIPGAPDWTADTMAVLFSGTKGLVATVAAILAGRGQLDVRAPVSHYWPEFAAAGKDTATVAHLLSHTVGLPYVDPEPPGEWADLDNAENARILARQSPLWTPGDKVAYHAITYGYLMTEVLRRVTGKDVGTLIRELIAEPLGIDVFLGLPAAEEPRVATIFRADDYAISTFLKDAERRKIVDRMYGGTLTGDRDTFNSAEMHRGQSAAGGGIGTADAMAKLYSVLAGPAEHNPVAPAALADATTTWSEGIDVINDRPLRFGLGYELADPIGTYGPVAEAFGHSGAGGGLHGGWPGAGIGFSFLTNEMLAEDKDRRAKDLLAALAKALE